MFNNLANYLFGVLNQEPATEDTASATRDVRLTAVPSDDDDWVLVDRDRDSEGDTDISSSLESIPREQDDDADLPYGARTLSVLLTRTSSTSSLPCTTGIEESWFLTPPPCFTSAGPVHMETSPLENLLIEHPSMSVYQHTQHAQHAQHMQHAQPALITRRHNSAPGSPAAGAVAADAAEAVDAGAGRRDATRRDAGQDQRAVQQQRRRAPTDALRQQERQCLKIKNAQKVQIHKACQSLKRGHIERNNKAREVNCRNHRQRRGERSQGSARSNANNNRKCC